jgi:hypothetical protein
MFQMFVEEQAGKSFFGTRLVLATAPYSGILPGIKRGLTTKAEFEGEMLLLSAGGTAPPQLSMVRPSV